MIENYSYETLDSIWVTQSDATAAVIYSFAWSGLVRGVEAKGGGRWRAGVSQGTRQRLADRARTSERRGMETVADCDDG